MIAQIIYLALFAIGVGLVFGKTNSDGSFTVDYSLRDSFIGTVIVLFVLWWGGFFENCMNPYGLTFLGWMLFGMGVHAARNGQTKNIGSYLLKKIPFFILEIFLIYKSGFLDPLFS
jgi:hypothetical protein